MVKVQFVPNMKTLGAKPPTKKEGGKQLSIGTALHSYRSARRESLGALAERFKYDRSTLGKIESGKRPCPQELENQLVKENWRFALKVMDERTGGWISNLLEKSPHLDLHPSALKEALLRRDARSRTTLEGFRLAKNPSAEDKERATGLWHRCKDVSDMVPVVMGVLEEMYELDREELIKKHEAALLR